MSGFRSRARRILPDGSTSIRSSEWAPREERVGAEMMFDRVDAPQINPALGHGVAKRRRERNDRRWAIVIAAISISGYSSASLKRIRRSDSIKRGVAGLVAGSAGTPREHPPGKPRQSRLISSRRKRLVFRHFQVLKPADANDPILLQHDLADEDRVGIARLPPGEVSPGSLEPSQ